MFRKSKNIKKGVRKRPTSDDEEDEETSGLLQEARQSIVVKKPRTAVDPNNSSDENDKGTQPLMQQYQTSKEAQLSEKDLATSTAQHHPEEKQTSAAETNDGIFRDKTRNKFLAGPLKASQFVRTTARFDYQPDICKDYKDTGFCGFGDTCIYLHDRGDTLTGWQLEQQWEEQKKKDAAQRELDAFADGKALVEEVISLKEQDGLPFACHICREAFKEPVVTRCGHYFCQNCILDHVRHSDKPTCPVCGKDTHGVFNQPIKLISKKRRMLSSSATWKEFHVTNKEN